MLTEQLSVGAAEGDKLLPSLGQDQSGAGAHLWLQLLLSAH